MINVTVNGAERTLEQGQSVADLLAALGLGQSPCAVELNTHVVPKRKHAEQTLSNGDKIEIVTLVGGG